MAAFIPDRMRTHAREADGISARKTIFLPRGTAMLTPAAYAREAQRRRHMAKHAADHPPGYTPERWRKHCLAVAEQYEREAMRGSDGRMH